MSEGGFVALVYRTLACFVRPPVDEMIETAIRPPRVCYSGFDPDVRSRTAERRRREEAARRAANRIASGTPFYPARVKPASSSDRGGLEQLPPNFSDRVSQVR